MTQIIAVYFVTLQKASVWIQFNAQSLHCGIKVTVQRIDEV